MTAFDQATIDEYTRAGHWDDDTVADLVARHLASDPAGLAFIAPDATLTWRQYDTWSTRLAGAYALGGWQAGEPVAVLLTGGALVHLAYLAAQKAGLVTVGIGPRAGDAEVRHLLGRSGSHTLVTRTLHRGRPPQDLAAGLRTTADLRRHVVLELTEDAGLRATCDGRPLPLPSVAEAEAALTRRALGANELFFLNSTSGTTGLPKCVMQTMNSRKYFGRLAAEAAQLRPDEIVASVVPSPYGFGQWSGHIVPTMYGYPTVLTEEFDADETLRLVEEHRVTVLAAVTSQFIMMLSSAALAQRDLSSLRVLFTGGEPVPYSRAAEFEDRTGCAILQFYGTNEAGPLSVTRVTDDRQHRLGTAGRVIPEMHVRLLGPDGADLTHRGGPGQAAARGPGLTPGYYRDPEANRKLFRPDGWMLTSDIARLDAEGYLQVTGRTADFIIRGGQNISILAVEQAILAACPRVAQVAVVAVPDEILGERACAYVVTNDGADLTLPELREHLADNGVSKHNWPERLATLDRLPLSPGGKTDRNLLRTDAANRFPPPS